MTTTPTDAPSDRDEKGEELTRLLKEDSPEREFLRDFVRTEFFGLEPLCPECEEEESESSESEREE